MVGGKRNVYYSLTAEIFGKRQGFATRGIHSYIFRFLGKKTLPQSSSSPWNNGLLGFHALLIGGCSGITVVWSLAQVEREEGRTMLSSSCCYSAQTSCPAHCFLLPLPVASKLGVPFMLLPSFAVVFHSIICTCWGVVRTFFFSLIPFVFSDSNLWSIEGIFLFSSANMA